jgi:hypothetical protein
MLVLIIDKLSTICHHMGPVVGYTSLEHNFTKGTTMPDNHIAELETILAKLKANEMSESSFWHGVAWIADAALLHVEAVTEPNRSPN